MEPQPFRSKALLSELSRQDLGYPLIVFFFDLNITSFIRLYLHNIQHFSIAVGVIDFSNLHSYTLDKGFNRTPFFHVFTYIFTTNCIVQFNIFNQFEFIT